MKEIIRSTALKSGEFVGGSNHKSLVNTAKTIGRIATPLAPHLVFNFSLGIALARESTSICVIGRSDTVIASSYEEKSQAPSKISQMLSGGAVCANLYDEGRSYFSRRLEKIK